MPVLTDQPTPAPGWVYAAPNPHTGRWHVVVEGHAACSARIELDGAELVTVGRAPLRPRCHRPACRSRWRPRLSPATQQQEQAQRDYAEQALIELQWTRPAANKAMWERRGWLRPHFVYVLKHSRPRVFQVGYTSQLTRVERLRKRRPGEPTLVDLVKVANRHAAVVVELELLSRVDHWRRELPAAKVGAGGTKVWSIRAPAVNLAAVVESLGLDTPR